ncbi:MAG: hypothetical protein WBK77_07400 [Alphaproteobacteria bacterium]
MKKFRLRTVFIFLMAALSGALLLHTSQNVHQAEVELDKVTEAANREKDSIRFLKAEWAYLNSPARLEALAQKYLGFEPASSAQIKTDGAEIPAKIILPPEETLQAQPVSYSSSPSPDGSPVKKTSDPAIKNNASGGRE